MNRTLNTLSSIDRLTGIANKRYFNEYFQKEWKKAQHNHTAISLIRFDLDLFGAYNDTYGRQRGFECLQQIASTVVGVVRRSTDLISQLDDGEFAVVLPETQIQGAVVIANKLRSTVERKQIPHSSSYVSPFVTISVGASSFYPSSYSTVAQAIQITNKALDQSKQQGRNSVTVHNMKTISLEKGIVENRY